MTDYKPWPSEQNAMEIFLKRIAELEKEDRWTRMGRIACRTCKREKGSDYTIGCPSCFDDEHKGFDE